MTFAILTIPLDTLAQSTFGVSIIQITPSEAAGSRGETVRLQGTIYTSNGSYQVFVGKTLVSSGKADGYYVETNFTVPELSAASYALILRDVAININASETFTVRVGYGVTPSSTSIQEGNSVALTVAVYGGSLGTNYGATVKVTSPGGTTSTTTVNLGTPNVQGTASKQLTFPSSEFSSAGDTTAAGTYQLSFNSTLASNSFNVDILDATTYHRGQSMRIHAVGYQANQAATITVTSGATTLDTISVTADANGIIDTTWVVSSNTPKGQCIVRISASGTSKSISDQQTFTTEGYTVNVKTVNLSGSVVPNINVECIDSATGTKTNQTSDASGMVSFGLEKGNHQLTAYWNSVNVGQTNITVTGDGTFTLSCQLSDMKITVKTQDGSPVPFVDLSISFRYQSGSISRSGSSTGQTGGTGSYTLASTVAGATYTIVASIYGKIFNTGNDTAISQSRATTQVTIICPREDLTLGITGYNNQGIPNARVELVEISNGLSYSATTNSNGVANTHATFGTYRLRIYKDSALVSESTLQVFNASEKQIRCTLYGIDVSVSVVDLFGSPISNADVTINGAQTAQATTASDGKVTFSSIIGGNMQIIAEVQGISGASQAITVNANEPTTVQVKLDKYISVGGILLQASILTTIVIILAIAMVFIIVEFIRRRKSKPSTPTAT